MKEPKKCVYCGKEFTPRIRTQIYCCTACRMNHEADKRAERAAKKPQKVIKCAVCGKEIVLPKFSNSRRKYCRECAVIVREQQNKACHERYKREGRKKKPQLSLAKLEARIEGVQRRQARLESNIKEARAQKLSYGEYKAKEIADKYARIDVEAFMKSLEARP